MIHIVCGLIGAGKSTFASKQDGIVTECEQGTKKEQISRTIEAHDAGSDVWHVTTYPTMEEIAAFSGYGDVEYIWINTTIRQAYWNILERSRARDLIGLDDTRCKNEIILQKYCNSKIRFRIVDIYQSMERW